MNGRGLAKRFGTPLYVYDERLIRERCRALQDHFPGATIHYAVKANANSVLLSIIRSEGCGIETVSPGEILLARKAKFPKEKTSFTCASLTEEELVIAARSCAYVHLDSLHQIEVWGKRKLGKNISIRLNQGIGAGHHKHVITGGPHSKFGISLTDVPEAKRLARKYGLRITGLAQHIGSNVLSTAIFVRALQKLLDTAVAFPDIEHIDFGGGFGIPYTPTERTLNLAAVGKEYVRRTSRYLKSQKRKVTFAFEPGRYLVAESGTLLVSVTDRKATSAHDFAGVNAGFNQLIRPAMYGSYHPITNLSRRSGVQKEITIAGNVCESGDLFAIDRRMTVPKIGDILAIHNAGAYGRSMASTYNARPLPREVLMRSNGTVKEI